MKFSNPIPGSKLKTSTFSKTVELPSFPNDTVIAPYDGVIVDYDPNNCGGKMIIKHVVNNEVYFSEFCNLISPSSFFSGVKIREGQTIGQVGTNNIEYTIKDGNGDKQNVSDFLFGVTKKTKEKIQIDNDSKETGNKDIDSLSNTLLKGMLFPFSMLGSTLNKDKNRQECIKSYENLGYSKSEEPKTNLDKYVNLKDESKCSKYFKSDYWMIKENVENKRLSEEIQRIKSLLK